MKHMTIQIACIIILILAVSAILFIVRQNHQTQQLINQRKNFRSKVIHISPIPTVGLGVTRDFIEASVQKYLPDISFSQSLPVQGEDTYIAQKDQNTIQLTGPANDLTEISSTASLNTDNVRNVKALAYMNTVTAIVDRDAGVWMSSALKTALDQNISLQNISTIIHKKKYMFSVVNNDLLKLFKITIDPVD